MKKKSKAPKGFPGGQKGWDEAQVAMADIKANGEKSIYWEDFDKATSFYDEKTKKFDIPKMFNFFNAHMILSKYEKEKASTPLTDRAV